MTNLIMLSYQQLLQDCEEGNLKRAKKMLSPRRFFIFKNPINVNVLIEPQSTYGVQRTLLHGAASGGNKEIVELLIDRGAEINVITAQGLTPLHIASVLGKTDIAGLLISHGALVDAPDNKGMTALHYAVSNRHTEVIKLLIASGADLNMCDKKGKRPIDIASDAGNAEMVELLRLDSFEILPVKPIAAKTSVNGALSATVKLPKAKGSTMDCIKRSLGLETKQEQFNRHLIASHKYLTKKQYDKAIAEARAAANLEPDNAQLHHVIGLSCVESGRKKEAIAFLERAVELDQNDTEILTALGNAYVQTNQYDKAVPVYRKVLERTPGYMKMHFNIGMSLFGANRFEESIEEFVKILRIEPRDPLPLAALEEASKNLNRKPVEKEEILRLKTLIDEGIAYIPEKKWAEAETSFKEALALCPDCVAATACLGCAYAMQNLFDKARPLLEAALAGNMESVEAKMGLSLLKISEGEIHDAVKEVAQLLGKKVKQS